MGWRQACLLAEHASRRPQSCKTIPSCGDSEVVCVGERQVVNRDRVHKQLGEGCTSQRALTRASKPTTASKQKFLYQLINPPLLPAMELWARQEKDPRMENFSACGLGTAPSPATQLIIQSASHSRLLNRTCRDGGDPRGQITHSGEASDGCVKDQTAHLLAPSANLQPAQDLPQRIRPLDCPA